MGIDLSAHPKENLLIDSLVNRAAELYNSYGDCRDRCNHPSGSCNDDFKRKSECKKCGVNDLHSVDCRGCCLECSEEVHFHKTNRNQPWRKEYDCQKLIYYYTCRYSWKYCSEIMYALESADLSKYTAYTVLSLGCGQSPDLMALEQINRAEQKNLSYTGYDKNKYWVNVHSDIQDYCLQKRNMQCRYEIGDVFKILQDGDDEFANIIILSYILSSFSDSERFVKAPLLFELIIRKVLAHKGSEPVLIIINDIDHYKARDYFDVFQSKLEQAEYSFYMQKKHFGDRGKDYKDGSVRYPVCADKFTIPSAINDNFHCAIQCTSAQCIIEVI